MADIVIRRIKIIDKSSDHYAAQGAAIMSASFKINEHIYRAYPTRYFCDGIEITSAEFYTAIRSLYHRD